MVKLTKEQIQIIDNYLIRKQVIYADLKLEILDHMISDIESEMETNQILFDDAFDKTIVKWKSSFLETSSFWLGLAVMRPKIIISKLTSTLKPLLFKLFISTILITVFLFVVDRSFLKINLNNYKENILVIIYVFAALNTLMLAYWAVLMYRSKIKTSFSFLYYRQVLVCCLYPLFITDTFLLKEGSINFISLSFIVYTVFNSLMGRELFKAHFKTSKAIQKFA